MAWTANVISEFYKSRWQLSNLVAFIRFNLFVKIHLYKWLDNPLESSPLKNVKAK